MLEATRFIAIGSGLVGIGFTAWFISIGPRMCAGYELLLIPVALFFLGASLVAAILWRYTVRKERAMISLAEGPNVPTDPSSSHE